MSYLIPIHSFGRRTVQAAWLGTIRYGPNTAALLQNCQGLWAVWSSEQPGEPREPPEQRESSGIAKLTKYELWEKAEARGRPCNLLSNNYHSSIALYSPFMKGICFV